MPIKNRKLFIYLLIFVFAFLLVFSRSGSFNPLEFTIVRTVSLPLRLILAPINEVKKIIFYHRIFDEYMRQRTEVDTLKNRLAGMNEVVQENSRLAQMLAFKRRLIYPSLAAGVVGRDPSNWNAAVIIDKGSVDGVGVGMPVVSASGVVGKVAEVGRERSKVILLTDPAFSVAALVDRSREVGLVSGSLRGICRMRYLSANADIQVGDQVVSSKVSSSFPEGLIIGEVVEVRTNNDGSPADCLIKPAVSLSQVEEVLVILRS